MLTFLKIRGEMVRRKKHFTNDFTMYGSIDSRVGVKGRFCKWLYKSFMPSLPSSIPKSMLRYINKCIYFTFFTLLSQKIQRKIAKSEGTKDISKQRVKDHLWLSVFELRKIVANSQTNKSPFYHAKNSKKRF